MMGNKMHAKDRENKKGECKNKQVEASYNGAPNYVLQVVRL